MGRFELKSQCFATKKGVIFKLENKDGYHFFQRVREPGEGGGVVKILIEVSVHIENSDNSIIF